MIILDIILQKYFMKIYLKYIYKIVVLGIN